MTRSAFLGSTDADRTPAFRAYAASERPITVHVGSGALVVGRDGEPAAELRWDRRGDNSVCLSLDFAENRPQRIDFARAACLALFESDVTVERIALQVDPGLGRRIAGAGIATAGADGLAVLPELLWQQPALWRHGSDHAPFPLRLLIANGVRHPLRAPKPEGVVYARFIPWLGETLSLRVADPYADARDVNRWMNSPRVAAIWEETGDLAHHRAYLEGKHADPHVLPLIGCFDEVPFGYFEVYWAKESRLGPYYEAHDYDRGWHVLVGEEAVRGKAWLSAWLPSLMHFMFLDDPRTQRIVGEPKASHAQQIRNLDRSGFAKVKHVDFPHKRALLVMLLRERFFEDRLWRPAADATAGLTAPAREDLAG